MISDSPLLVRCAPVFYASCIEPSSERFTCDKPVCLRMKLLSNLVESIEVDTICVSVIFWTPDVDPAAAAKNSVRRRSQAGALAHSRQPSGPDRCSHSREPSGSSVVGIDLYNRIQETIQASSQPLDLHPLVELQVDEELASSSAVVCRSPLRRLKSIPGATKEREIIKGEWNHQLTAADRVIKPGTNELSFGATVSARDALKCAISQMWHSIFGLNDAP